jgi:hypothetical protein
LPNAETYPPIGNQTLNKLIMRHAMRGSLGLGLPLWPITQDVIRREQVFAPDAWRFLSDSPPRHCQMLWFSCRNTRRLRQRQPVSWMRARRRPARICTARFPARGYFALLADATKEDSMIVRICLGFGSTKCVLIPAGPGQRMLRSSISVLSSS